MSIGVSKGISKYVGVNYAKYDTYFKFQNMIYVMRNLIKYETKNEKFGYRKPLNYQL